MTRSVVLLATKAKFCIRDEACYARSILLPTSVSKVKMCDGSSQGVLGRLFKKAFMLSDTFELFPIACQPGSYLSPMIGHSLVFSIFPQFLLK